MSKEKELVAQETKVRITGMVPLGISGEKTYSILPFSASAAAIVASVRLVAPVMSGASIRFANFVPRRHHRYLHPKA